MVRKVACHVYYVGLITSLDSFLFGGHSYFSSQFFFSASNLPFGSITPAESQYVKGTHRGFIDLFIHILSESVGKWLQMVLWLHSRLSLGSLISIDYWSCSISHSNSWVISHLQIFFKGCGWKNAVEIFLSVCISKLNLPENFIHIFFWVCRAQRNEYMYAVHTPKLHGECCWRVEIWLNSTPVIPHVGCDIYFKPVRT